MAVRIQRAASLRLDEIFRYTRDRWGDAEAPGSHYGLFEAFARLESHTNLSRPVPATFGADGYVCRYRHHLVYWRRLANGDTDIVTIVHDRLHQFERFREDFGAGG